jgi:hypothetical protein
MPTRNGSASQSTKSIASESYSERYARIANNDSDQDRYWKSVSQKNTDKSASYKGQEGDSITAGHRIEELGKIKDLVAKKNYIIADIKKEVESGKLTGDLESIGNVKVGGNIGRAARYQAINLVVTVPETSAASQALRDFRTTLDSLDRTKNYDERVRAVRDDFFKSVIGSEIKKLGERVKTAYEQFNYTRMNSNDDGYATNFYGAAKVVFKGPDGKSYDERGYTYQG